MANRTALLVVVAACEHATPDLRVDVMSKGHETFSLEVRYRNPILTTRLNGLAAKVRATCDVGGRAVTDEVLTLAPMIQDPDIPNLIHTTDDLEGEVFYAQGLPARPQRCEIAIETSRDHGPWKPLFEACMAADETIAPGRCKR